MSLNQEVLGQRLRSARENCGFSQLHVADALGLSRTAITQIEGGRRSVSTLELSELAKLYNCPIVDFFAEEGSSDDNPLLALHRIAPNLEHDPKVKDQVHRCLNICREGAELEVILGRMNQDALPSYSQGPLRNTGDAVRQGSLVADQERQRLGLGKAPISDMSDLIASQGIWVSGAHLPDEMSGFFLHGCPIGMAILVNFDHPRVRKRFSYAHEYAHALFDRGRSATVSTRDNASDLIEKRANAFAAAFLMPSAGIDEFLRLINKGQGSRQESQVYDVANEAPFDVEIRALPGSQTITYQDVAIIAHHFGVSYQAATYRLLSLDVISQNSCSELLTKDIYGKEFLEMLQLVESEKRSPDKELETQVVRLAIEAYRREEISRGKLVDIGKLLGFSGRKLTELAEAARNHS